MTRIIVFLIAMLIFYSCNKLHLSNDELYKGYKFDKLNYQLSINKLEQYHKEIRYDSISLIFKKEFNDEVEIFLNDNFHKKILLTSDIESTLIPSVEVKIKNQYGENRVLIRLLNKKRMVEFSYDPRIPFYEISYYNDLWYINGIEGEITNIEKESN